MEASEIYTRLNELVEEKIEVENLTPETDLAALGLDSLDRADIMMRIEDEFGIELSEDEMVQIATLEDLEKTIESKVSNG